MALQAQYPVTLVRTGQIDPRAKWLTAIYDEIRQRIKYERSTSKQGEP